MKVMVFGSRGQLGKELVKILGLYPEFTTEECFVDIRKKHKVLEEMDDFLPDVVVNCAAMTDVRGCERSRIKAWEVNAIGPKDLAINASVVGARLIHLSTDFVFSGEEHVKSRGASGYHELDPTMPINHYGYTKREGEYWVRLISPRNTVVRTSCLFGTYGSNFLKSIFMAAMRKQSEGESVRVVSDQITCPTSATILAGRLLLLIRNYTDGGIFHLCSEDSTSWLELTKYFFQQMNLDAQVQAVTSVQYEQLTGDTTRRPKCSVLKNKLFHERMPPWKEHVDEFARQYKKELNGE